MKGLVFKAVGGSFWLLVEGKVFISSARKKNRSDGNEILVGDYVDYNAEEKVIEKVYERKNRLLRPMVSNVSQLLIFVTTQPEADFVLVDKLLIHCFAQNIKPVVIVSKTDIVSDIFFCKIKEQYGFIEVVGLSVYDKSGLKDISELLKNNITCLAGQSATGKTSLVNVINSSSVRATGELSKINRGKHTTRHNELIVIDETSYVIDTAGFSLFEDTAVLSYDLCLYYPDFLHYSHLCKYHMCTHTTEPACAVKDATASKELSVERYLRYLEIFNLLREKEKNKY